MKDSGESVEALEKEADRTEQMLLGLEMPVRVSEGETRNGAVRYHLTPMHGVRAQRLREAADDVARALGVPDIGLTEEASRVSIKVPRGETGVRLVPLIRSLAGLRPLTAVLGLSASGHPILLPLDAKSTWHFQVIGQSGAGKSELLRTLTISLAMTSRPTQMRILAVDIGGRELAVLESLPHLAADLATEPEAGARLVCWLAAQTETRLAGRPHGTDWLLVLDDLSWVMASDGGQARAALRLLLAQGPHVGVHIAAGRRIDSGKEGLEFPGDVTVTAVPLSQVSAPREFLLRAGAEDVALRAAWLPAADLDRAVRWISGGWQAA